jgi:hypothetical protein
MWGDERFRSLSAPQPNGQSLWIYLLTGPHTTSIPGLFAAGEAGLAEALGWPSKAFREGFAEISAKGMAKADWAARVVWLPKAVSYNAPESPNVVRSWAQHFDDIPECHLKWQAFLALKDFIEGLGEGFRKAFAEAFREPLSKAMANQEQEQEPEQEQEVMPSPAVAEAAAALATPKWPSPEAMVALYHEHTPAGHPRVKTLTAGRRQKASAYLKQFPDREFWVGVFAEIGQSPLLMGQRQSNGHRGFIADLDWLLTRGKDGTENCVKVTEGKYRDDAPVLPPRAGANGPGGGRQPFRNVIYDFGPTKAELDARAAAEAGRG